jgi:2,4-dienoyl-CoA reductase-like NADH-dependent reductase (Old Yellow Enzyme family)
MTTLNDPLSSPLTLGDISLGRRVVMAPLIRMRSRQLGDVPQPMNVVLAAFATLLQAIGLKRKG